jgi:hypothetical protein
VRECRFDNCIGNRFDRIGFPKFRAPLLERRDEQDCLHIGGWDQSLGSRPAKHPFELIAQTIDVLARAVAPHRDRFPNRLELQWPEVGGRGSAVNGTNRLERRLDPMKLAR